MFYVSEENLSKFLEPEPEDELRPAPKREKAKKDASKSAEPAQPEQSSGPEKTESIEKIESRPVPVEAFLEELEIPPAVDDFAGLDEKEAEDEFEEEAPRGRKRDRDAGGRRPRTLMMRAVDALSRREYSRLELGRKLRGSLREGETPDDVEEVLETLQNRGYLDNARYAASRVRSRAARYGNRRLAGELAQMGVERETIAESLTEAGDEFERARVLWRRKFGRLPQDKKERDRQTRYFASRGFGFDVISRLLSGAGLEDDEEDFG